MQRPHAKLNQGQSRRASEQIAGIICVIKTCGRTQVYLPLPLYPSPHVLLRLLLSAAVDLLVAVAQHAPRETLGEGTQFIVLFALCQLLVNTLHGVQGILVGQLTILIFSLLVNTLHYVGYIGKSLSSTYLFSSFQSATASPSTSRQGTSQSLTPPTHTRTYTLKHTFFHSLVFFKVSIQSLGGVAAPTLSRQPAWGQLAVCA